MQLVAIYVIYKVSVKKRKKIESEGEKNVESSLRWGSMVRVHSFLPTKKDTIRVSFFVARKADSSLHPPP